MSAREAENSISSWDEHFVSFVTLFDVRWLMLIFDPLLISQRSNISYRSAACVGTVALNGYNFPGSNDCSGFAESRSNLPITIAVAPSKRMADVA